MWLWFHFPDIFPSLPESNLQHRKHFKQKNVKTSVSCTSRHSPRVYLMRRDSPVCSAEQLGRHASGERKATARKPRSRYEAVSRWSCPLTPRRTTRGSVLCPSEALPRSETDWTLYRRYIVKEEHTHTHTERFLTLTEYISTKKAESNTRMFDKHI